MTIAAESASAIALFPERCRFGHVDVCFRLKAGAMSFDQRRFPRKRINAVAFLYTVEGGALGNCRVKDISSGGARLAHSLSDELPAEFLISFSRNGRVRRRCETRWRKDGELGVRFL
jgi:PilZ domain